ncbi:hypothetical protein LEMLEM_LOCUS15134, partial [Lemmus lemmus]
GKTNENKATKLHFLPRSACRVSKHLKKIIQRMNQNDRRFLCRAAADGWIQTHFGVCRCCSRDRIGQLPYLPGVSQRGRLEAHEKKLGHSVFFKNNAGSSEELMTGQSAENK